MSRRAALPPSFTAYRSAVTAPPARARDSPRPGGRPPPSRRPSDRCGAAPIGPAARPGRRHGLAGQPRPVHRNDQEPVQQVRRRLGGERKRDQPELRRRPRDGREQDGERQDGERFAEALEGETRVVHAADRHIALARKPYIPPDVVDARKRRYDRHRRQDTRITVMIGEPPEKARRRGPPTRGRPTNESPSRFPACALRPAFLDALYAERPWDRGTPDRVGSRGAEDVAGQHQNSDDPIRRTASKSRPARTTAARP